MIECLRPWKLLTLAFGLAILVVGARIEQLPDWDTARMPLAPALSRQDRLAKQSEHESTAPSGAIHLLEYIMKRLVITAAMAAASLGANAEMVSVSNILATTQFEGPIASDEVCAPSCV